MLHSNVSWVDFEFESSTSIVLTYVLVYMRLNQRYNFIYFCPVPLIADVIGFITFSRDHYFEAFIINVRKNSCRDKKRYLGRVAEWTSTLSYLNLVLARLKLTWYNLALKRLRSSPKQQVIPWIDLNSIYRIDKGKLNFKNGIPDTLKYLPQQRYAFSISKLFRLNLHLDPMKKNSVLWISK